MMAPPSDNRALDARSGRQAAAGPGLWLARAGWLFAALLVLSVLAANLPYLVDDIRWQWQMREAWPAARSIFSGRLAFARWLAVWRLATGLVFVITAGLLAWRKWWDAPVLIISAALLLLTPLFTLAFNVDRTRFPEWLEGAVPETRGITMLLMVVGLLALFALFPDGRFVPRSLRWPALAVNGNALLWTALFAFPPLARLAEAAWPALGSESGPGWTIFFFSVIAALLTSLGGQGYRYARVSSPDQRQQTKWAVLGLGSFLAVTLAFFLIFDLAGLQETPFAHLVLLHLEPLLGSVIPLTIGFSVLRYRLWEVDLWLNRALVYGLLSLLIIAAYGLLVGLFSQALPAGGGGFTRTLALLAAVLLAVPLQPRLQAAAARRFPGPPRTPPADAPQPAEPPAIRFWPAQIVWLALLAVLVWENVPGFAAFSQQIEVISNSWLSSTAFQALGGAVSAEAFAVYVLLLDLLNLAVFWGLACLIFWKRRGDGMALLVATFLLLSPFSLGPGGELAPLSEALGFLGLLLFVALLFVFPDGRFVPRGARARWLLLALPVLTPLLAVPLLLWLIRPTPDGESAGYLAGMLTLGVIMTAGVASQVVRYRAEPDPVRRQQSKWILFGFGLQLTWIGWLVFWLIAQAWLPLDQSQWALVMLHLILLAPLGLALSIAFSILRYRLWDIDLLVQRALVYGTLTAAILLAYVLIVGGVGLLLRGGSAWLAVITTGAIALAFQPLREWLQRGANRLLYGEQVDPVELLSRLGSRLELVADADALLPALVETVANAFRLPYVAIEINGASEPAAATGSPAGPLENFPLLYQGVAIGRLRVARRAPGEAFTGRERRLLATIAHQAGAAAHAVRLTADLRRSRQRLVIAREEERRRLRRDLHDGLGPQLATLTLQIEAARHLLESEPAAVDDLLRELKGGVQNGLAEIRRVVHELRPATLDQLGLAAAIGQHAAALQVGGLAVTVDAPDPFPPLPAAVEVAAYRIATEALTNTARHAGATICAVRLGVANGVLHLEVSDDGRGLPAGFQPGVGLTSMRERAAELGGSLTLNSRPGLHLAAALPIGEETS